MSSRWIFHAANAFEDRTAYISTLSTCFSLGVSLLTDICHHPDQIRLQVIIEDKPRKGVSMIRWIATLQPTYPISLQISHVASKSTLLAAHLRFPYRYRMCRYRVGRPGPSNSLSTKGGMSRALLVLRIRPPSNTVKRSWPSRIRSLA